MKVPKTVTPAKIAANQENAKKSTGPTSERGKYMSRRNAIRHDILAEEVLLPGESETELEQLEQEWMESYEPVGAGERLQVRIILTNTWRLRRVHRAEVGAVATTLADHEPAAEIAASRHMPQYLQACADRVKLDGIEAEINRTGHVSAENLNWTRGLTYGGPVRLFVATVELIQASMGHELESAAAQVAAPGKEQQSSSPEAEGIENASPGAEVAAAGNEQQCSSPQAEDVENASPGAEVATAEGEHSSSSPQMQKVENASPAAEVAATERHEESSSPDTENAANADPPMEVPTMETEGLGASDDTIGSQEVPRCVRVILLSALKSLRVAIERAQVAHAEHIASKVTAQADALLVPGEATLNRLMQYEAHLLRNIYRAEHALERAQRLRLGDDVPPPSARVG